MPRTLHLVISTVIWCLIGVNIVLIVDSSVPYLFGDGPFRFVLEKEAVGRWGPWYAAFVVHVATAVPTLIIGPAMFSRRLLAAAPRVHRWLGRGYALLVLAFAAPSALFLSLYAKGGVLGRLGFMVLGALWMWTTWMGTSTALQRRFIEHARWMVTSFAIAMSAIHFRLVHIALSLAGVRPYEAYIAANWGSLVLSLLLAAWWLSRMPRAPRQQPVGRPVRSSSAHTTHPAREVPCA